MSKRRYINMLALLPEIERMLESGMSHREIEEKLGLEGDRPVHNLLKRQRRKAVKGVPKQRGKNRVSPLKRWLKGLKSLSDTYIELKTKAKSQVSMFSIN